MYLNMKTTFVRAVTADKIELQGLLYEPANKTQAVVLHIHGMSGNFYENFFLDAMRKQYTNANIALLSVSTRGTGAISDIMIADSAPKWQRLGAAYEIFEDSQYDIEAWVQVLISKGYTKIFLQGHSLGGSKIVYYQSQKHPAQVKGLILLSATEMICYSQANSDFETTTAEAKKLVSEGKGEHLLTNPIWEDEFILSANTYLNFTTKDNPIDVFKGYDKTAEATIGLIDVPMLAIMGTQDNGPKMFGSTPEEYMKLLQAKSKNCPDFQIFVPDTTHGYFQHEQEVAGRITEWLKAQ
jgi:pimeloyl-ACP methyl ester carboxylesterase